MKRARTISEFQDSSVGLDDTGFANIGSEIPADLKVGKIKSAIGAKRIPIHIRADQTQYDTNTNRLIRIALPTGSNFDMRKAHLTFTLALAKTGGSYIRVHQHIFSIFNRLRVLYGSVAIEDNRDYNRRCHIVNQAENNRQAEWQTQGLSMGFGTQAQRNAWGAATSTDYVCQLFSGIINTEFLPFENFKKTFYLELYLEDPTVCLETDGTNPVITISNIMFNIEHLELQKNFRESLASLVATKGLVIGWHNYERNTQALTTGQNQTINITQKHSSINGFMNIFVNSAAINDMTQNDRMLTWPSLSLSLAQLFINNKTFPDEPIDCVFSNSSFVYDDYLKWIDSKHTNYLLKMPVPISQYEFVNSSKFLQIDNFEAFPGADDLINPMNNIDSTVNIQKRLTFPGSIASNYQYDTYIKYFTVVQLFTDGTVKEIQ